MNQSQRFYLILAISLIWAGPLRADDWTQFRGSNSDGHAKASQLPVEFGEQKNLVWKTAIPGRAWSSPVVIGEQIWLTTAIERDASEEERKKMLRGVRDGGLTAYSSVQLFAICIDRTSGKIIHNKPLFSVNQPPLINTLNSFASPTPVIDGPLVYCNFGSFGTVCLKRSDGSEVWRNTDYRVDHQTGPGSSPLLHAGKLIVPFDGIDKQFLVALDARTGREVWKVERSGKLHDQPDFKKAFSTPIVVTVAGAHQLISAGADWVYGYDPENGKELWKVPFGQLGFSNAPQPLFADGVIYICTGFMRSQLLAIDISNGTATADDIQWRFREQVPSMPTPVLVDDRIYLISDRGIATCVSKEGKKVWQQRLGGSFSASPIFADGKIYYANRDGKVFVVEPGDRFELRATNQLDSRVMATPVAVDKSLFIRSEKSLYHFQKR